MARRRRELGAEEQELWLKVTQSVAPLDVTRRRRKRLAKQAAEEGLAEPPHDDAPVSAPSTQKTPPPRPDHAAAPPPPKKPALRPLVPIDTRTRRKIARGSVEVAARIDLHGMTQREAFPALRAFLARTQMAGGRIAIVITGKGRPGTSDHMVFDPNERGVLRRVVPQWLSSPDLRDLVGGFEEATPGHGGAGALYVRLRRPKNTTLV